MNPKIEALYHQHVGRSWEKQLFLDSWAAELGWTFDMDAGTLSFSDGSQWHIQVLGTESLISYTWLWGWADRESEIPEPLLRMSLIMKALGEKDDIEEFRTRKLELDEFSADYLALIASGVCQARAYYRCAYEGGALYVLIDDPRWPEDRRPLMQRMVSTFVDVVGRSDVANHRLAFEWYVQGYGLQTEVEGEQIRVRVPNEGILVAQFDRWDRLVRLEGPMTV
jgi:hypothetical protein